MFGMIGIGTTQDLRRIRLSRSPQLTTRQTMERSPNDGTPVFDEILNYDKVAPRFRKYAAGSL